MMGSKYRKKHIMREFAVAVITPSTGICRMEYAQSLARLIGYFSQHKIFEDCDEQVITTDSVLGSIIGGNYEELVLRYLNDTNVHWTHFLSVEDDMGFAPECLEVLARHELPIVGANYSVNKGYPLRFTASQGNNFVETREESTGLEEVYFIPQGFTLVERSVFEKIDKPWFLNGYNAISGKYIAQDYYFSEQARRCGFKLFIDHDVSKRVFHVGPHLYTWADVIAQGVKNNGRSERGLCGEEGKLSPEKQDSISDCSSGMEHTSPDPCGHC